MGDEPVGPEGVSEVGAMTSELTEIGVKLDALTKHYDTENIKRDKRIRLSRILIVIALVVGISSPVISIGYYRYQRGQDADDMLTRRTADCQSLGAIAEANIVGANRIVINPATRDAYAMGMRDAYAQVKALKGYSVDCTQIGPPPTTQPGG